jgi:uncharacterized protein DUF6502
MPDNVKTTLSVSIKRLMRPLVKIMLREGMTYSHFAALAQMAFVECAAKDFARKGMKSPASSVCALTGMSPEQVRTVVREHEQFEASELFEIENPFARVLHGWHNDRDYVGPYGFPIDLPFDEGSRNFTVLAGRHAPGVLPETILLELRRVGAVTEVGANVWKPLKQEYIEPSLSPINLKRMASLVESLLATLENNTSSTRTGTDLFERTVNVDSPLSMSQLLALQAYMKTVGAQFLQRADTFAAVDLQEKMGTKPGERADINVGLECFLFVEPKTDSTVLRDAIEFTG